jgi:hypothetical protein
MTVEIPSRYPPLTRPATASRSLPGGSLLVSALAQFSMSADTNWHEEKDRSLHEVSFGFAHFIVGDAQFRQDTKSKPEKAIQTEISPLFIRFLEKYISDAGYKDSTAEANKSFY